ncbi:hypothetical protein E4U53_003465, partial [Claviceps sorghi]
MRSYRPQQPWIPADLTRPTCMLLGIVAAAVAVAVAVATRMCFSSWHRWGLGSGTLLARGFMGESVNMPWQR